MDDREIQARMAALKKLVAASRGEEPADPDMTPQPIHAPEPEPELTSDVVPDWLQPEAPSVQVEGPPTVRREAPPEGPSPEDLQHHDQAEKSGALDKWRQDMEAMHQAAGEDETDPKAARFKRLFGVLGTVR